MSVVDCLFVHLSFAGSSAAPSRAVSDLSANQTGSVVLLSWKDTAMEHQRGFIRGYTVYRANAAHLDLIGKLLHITDILKKIMQMVSFVYLNNCVFVFPANISDPEVQAHRVKGLSLSSYKFVVKAYTSAGEDAGSTVAIKVEMDSKKNILSLFCN